MASLPSHVVGIDDGAFSRGEGGEVLVVGAVFAGLRLEGVISTAVSQDGDDATDTLVQKLTSCRYQAHLQVIMMQGIALGGFNVVDIHRLSEETGLGVIVLTRKAPNMDAIRHVLHSRVPNGIEKWRLIQAAGPMAPMGALMAQCAGIAPDVAQGVVEASIQQGNLPEPIRVAHLIASGVTLGSSSRRP